MIKTRHPIHIMVFVSSNSDIMTNLLAWLRGLHPVPGSSAALDQEWLLEESLCLPTGLCHATQTELSLGCWKIFCDHITPAGRQNIGDFHCYSVWQTLMVQVLFGHMTRWTRESTDMVVCSSAATHLESPPFYQTWEAVSDFSPLCSMDFSLCSLNATLL